MTTFAVIFSAKFPAFSLENVLMFRLIKKYFFSCNMKIDEVQLWPRPVELGLKLYTLKVAYIFQSTLTSSKWRQDIVILNSGGVNLLSSPHKACLWRHRREQDLRASEIKQDSQEHWPDFLGEKPISAPRISDVFSDDDISVKWGGPEARQRRLVWYGYWEWRWAPWRTPSPAHPSSTPGEDTPTNLCICIASVKANAGFQ
jgi:hypothetical protein